MTGTLIGLDLPVGRHASYMSPDLDNARVFYYEMLQMGGVDLCAYW